MSKPKIIVIVGPTSSGKTSLSVEIAKKWNGEIISADSRQVYEGMDLGTGKVTKEEMAGIPHHLLDMAKPMQVYSGANFKHDATIAINDIIARQKQPIIAGGTFFYIDLLRNSQQAAPVAPNPELRAKLEELSTEELFSTLQNKDTARAEVIDKHNRHRLIRSLEIIEALGSVPLPQTTESPYEWLLIGLELDKQTLHQNIHLRLKNRLEAGMIDEVKRLISEGVTYERLAAFGLEYRYLAKYLKGEIDYDTAVNEIETKTRQFAKRQLTWLKRDKSIEWFLPENREAIFRRITNFLEN